MKIATDSTLWCFRIVESDKQIKFKSPQEYEAFMSVILSKSQHYTSCDGDHTFKLSKKSEALVIEKLKSK